MVESKTGAKLRERGTSKKACAFLWDESLAWGLMAYQALTEAGLPFDILRSEDIRGGYGDWNMGRWQW